MDSLIKTIGYAPSELEPAMFQEFLTEERRRVSDAIYDWKIEPPEKKKKAKKAKKKGTRSASTKQLAKKQALLFDTLKDLGMTADELILTLRRGKETEEKK